MLRALALCALVAAPVSAQAPAAPKATPIVVFQPDSALAQRVRAAVAGRWAVAPGAVRLSWGRVRATQAPGADARFRLVGSGASGEWVVDILSGATRTVGIRVRAGVVSAERVAAHDIPRGATLAAADMAHRQLLRWGPPRGHAAVAEGWVAQRRITAGEPLREPAVSPPLVVRAGESVTIVWHQPGIALSLAGRALGSAVKGAAVPVITASGRRLRGVATRSGVVDLAATGGSR